MDHFQYYFEPAPFIIIGPAYSEYMGLDLGKYAAIYVWVLPLKEGKTTT